MEVVARAQSRLGECCYKLLTNNCEYFVTCAPTAKRGLIKYAVLALIPFFDATDTARSSDSAGVADAYAVSSDCAALSGRYGGAIGSSLQYLSYS
ncbi:lecithin retinol acyltransferase family protein [Pseudomonas putida]|uniref:lecithin retinol acyltransferase family protein n=1 Tax=Pseudomonas putida TaxID=303 RepID=UPI003CC80C0F